MIGLFLMMSSLVIMTNANRGCPDTWTISGDSCYKFIAAKTTWFDAQVICKTANSHVVRIESRDEDNFVIGMVRLYVGGEPVWIGLSDLMQEGRFVWDDTQERPSYTNWSPPNPSDTNGNEDCGSIWDDAMWNDAPCEFKLSTICEKPSSV